MYEIDDKKMQRSFTRFDRNIKDFVGGKIPCQLSLNRLWFFRKGGWLASVSKNGEVINALRQLYEIYGVLPAPVLLILLDAVVLQHDRALREPLKKTARERKADAAKIDAAVRVIQDYGLPGGSVEKDNVTRYLRYFKSRIENARRPKKMPDVHMRFTAQTLRLFFKAVANQPLDEYVGGLMHHALGWPHVSENLRLAALQRAKGPVINATRLALTDALDLQREDYSYWQKYQEKYAERFDGDAVRRGEELYVLTLLCSKQFPLNKPQPRKP